MKFIINLPCANRASINLGYLISSTYLPETCELILLDNKECEKHIDSIKLTLMKGKWNYIIRLYGNVEPYEILVDYRLLPKYNSMVDLDANSEGWLQYNDRIVIIYLKASNNIDILLEIDCA